MINKNVLENMNLESDKFQGFAWGVGIERIAMMKYGISDLRRFYKI